MPTEITWIFSTASLVYCIPKQQLLVRNTRCCLDFGVFPAFDFLNEWTNFSIFFVSFAASTVQRKDPSGKARSMSQAFSTLPVSHTDNHCLTQNSSWAHSHTLSHVALIPISVSLHWSYRIPIVTITSVIWGKNVTAKHNLFSVLVVMHLVLWMTHLSTVLVSSSLWDISLAWEYKNSVKQECGAYLFVTIQETQCIRWQIMCVIRPRASRFLLLLFLKCLCPMCWFDICNVSMQVLQFLCWPQ